MAAELALWTQDQEPFIRDLDGLGDKLARASRNLTALRKAVDRLRVARAPGTQTS